MVIHYHCYYWVNLSSNLASFLLGLLLKGLLVVEKLQLNLEDHLFFFLGQAYFANLVNF